jgi:hypothetical protein
MKNIMKDAAMNLLGTLAELDPKRISSVTINFDSEEEMGMDEGEEPSHPEYPMPEGESCEYCECPPSKRGKGACCDRCGMGECPDCGAEMEDNMCPECEYEDTSMSDLQRMKHKYGAPHMMKMKKMMDKGASPMQAHKSVGSAKVVRPIGKYKEAEAAVNKLQKPQAGRVG